MDLAKQVAATIGPERILGKAGVENAANPLLPSWSATALTVEVPPNSSVIRIAFQHPDPAVVQPVLAAIVDAYLKKHVEIHEALGIVRRLPDPGDGSAALPSGPDGRGTEEGTKQGRHRLAGRFHEGLHRTDCHDPPGNL